MRAIERLTRGSLLIAAKALLLLVVLGYGGAYSWVLDAVAAFRLHLAFAAALLVLAALTIRRWWAASIAFLAAILATLGLGPALQDPISRNQGPGPQITLLYANLFDANPTPDAAAQALLDAGADILVTSETMAPVADMLESAYQHRVLYRDDPRSMRTAIWSRFALGERNLFLDNNLAPTAAAAVVTLEDGTQFHLTGVHFARAIEGLRKVQTNALGDIAGSRTRPRIVIGDFNAAPWSWTLTWAAAATGTQVLGGYRITWSGSYPTPAGALPSLWGQNIDTMLYSDRIAVRAVETLALPGSDHRILLVRVQIMTE